MGKINTAKCGEGGPNALSTAQTREVGVNMNREHEALFLSVGVCYDRWNGTVGSRMIARGSIVHHHHLHSKSRTHTHKTFEYGITNN